MKKLSLLCLIGLFISCQQQENKEIPEELPTITLQEIPFDRTNSSEPNLTKGPDGKIYMSWVEKSEEGASLSYATLDENQWTKQTKIANGENWFVNWADFPSLLVTDSFYAAHFLAYTAEGKYSYGVNLVSSESGSQWSEPMLAHDDGTPTEHGFVTLLPMGQENYMAVWLDGRKYVDTEEHEATKEMTLRSAIFDKEGNKLDEDIIDPRTCDCCQTDGVITSRGPAIVYRDRGLMEVRDIYMSRFENGEWLEPWVVHSDNWEIPGCPVNGPAIDTNGDKLAVAWFTAANGTSKVMITFSENVGDDFSEPVRIDLGNPLGRVDVKQFENFAVVSWMEEKNDTAFVYCRKVNLDGSFEEPIVVVETSSSRSSGFPRMEKDGNDLIFAWTVAAGESSHIETSRATFNP